MVTIEDIKNVHAKRKSAGKKLHTIVLWDKYVPKNCGLDFETWRTVVNTVLEEVAERILRGEQVKLPCLMGSIGLRRKERKVKLDENGKPKINTPVNWGATVKLWAEDENARLNKTVVRQECKNIYSIIHTKDNIIYLSANRILFTPTRSLKLRLRDKLKEGEIDCCKLERDFKRWRKEELALTS